MQYCTSAISVAGCHMKMHVLSGVAFSIYNNDFTYPSAEIDGGIPILCNHKSRPILTFQCRSDAICYSRKKLQTGRYKRFVFESCAWSNYSLMSLLLLQNLDTGAFAVTRGWFTHAHSSHQGIKNYLLVSVHITPSIIVSGFHGCDISSVG